MSRSTSVTIEDQAVLHSAAQSGKLFLRWPEDKAWLETIHEIGDPLAQLAGLTRRGSLVSIGKQRWLIMPTGASSVEQAAPVKALLTALLEGRGNWYLGCLSALIDHGLTDIDSAALYVVSSSNSLPNQLHIGRREVKVVHRRQPDSWVGVERERAAGRVFSYRSDLERTLLDTLDYPRHCGSAEIWVRAWERAMREERVDLGKLIDYSDERTAVAQARLAYWLRETGHPREARRVLRGIGGPVKGSQPLDAGRSFAETGTKRARDKETGLVLNIQQQTIDGWLTYGK